MKRRIFTLIIGLTLFQPVKADPVIPPVPFDLFIKMIHLFQQQESTNVLESTSASKTLKLRIKKDYEVFDAKGKLILKGSGKEIDIEKLTPGKYTIKFDKDYNQIEYFKKV